MIYKDFQLVSAFEYRDMRAWCKDQFGAGGYIWPDGKNAVYRWDSWSNCDNLPSNEMMLWTGMAFFSFSEDKDATMFLLRWG